jgi:hypothetical protein
MASLLRHSSCVLVSRRPPTRWEKHSGSAALLLAVESSLEGLMLARVEHLRTEAEKLERLTSEQTQLLPPRASHPSTKSAALRG